MLQVMMYAVAVTAALSLMGYCEERLAFMREMPRRWVWAVTMALSIIFPLAGMLWVGPAVRAAPELPVAFQPSPSSPASAFASGASSPLLYPVSTEEVQGYHLSPPSDQTLLAIWAGASGLLLLRLAGASLLLRRRSSHWRRVSVLGRELLISESTGPALLGALRPRIVVPGWFMEESPVAQALIVQHEEQHMAARDPLLLRVAQLLVFAMPWNLPLWWQLRRLRQSIELDCDARVLRRGAKPSEYGAVLLAVTQRASNTPAGLIAMSVSVSALEQRIRNLTPEASRHSVVRAVALLLLWIVGIGIAAALEAPPLPRSERDNLREGPSPAQIPSQTPSPPKPMSQARTITPADGEVALPRLLPPQRMSVPNRRESIERALVERHPELVNGPERSGDAFVSMRLRPDGSVESSDLKFVEAGDVASLESARSLASAEYLDQFSGQLLLARGWQIAGGATVRSQVRVSYETVHDRSRTISPTQADIARVVEHYLPEVPENRGTATARMPWLALSQDGRVLRSGYVPATASPATWQQMLQEELSGLSVGQIVMTTGGSRTPGARTRPVMLVWVAP